MSDKKEPSKNTIYKSPKRKLVQFFEKSRDKWKTKCQESKYRLKLLKNKIKYIEKRNAELKARVLELEKELEENRVKKN